MVHTGLTDINHGRNKVSCIHLQNKWCGALRLVEPTALQILWSTVLESKILMQMVLEKSHDQVEILHQM
jgi:hypothetical protein